MTNFLYTLLILFVTMTSVQAQFSMKAKSDKILESTMSIQSSEVGLSDRIISISSKGYAIFEEIQGDQQSYYLYNTSDQKKVKILLTKSVSSRKEKVQFADKDQFVITKKLQGTKKVLDIFDTKNNESILISSEIGSVVSASVHEKNKIIYQVRPENDRPMYFLNNEESTPKFISNGIAAKWAPNGEIFIIHRNKNSNLTTKEEIYYKKLSKDQIKERLKSVNTSEEKIEYVHSIFNQEGEHLFDLDNFDVIDWIEWSPDSKKILMEAKSYEGFYILSLENSGGATRLENTLYFPGFKSDNEGWHGCVYPKWSPDGQKILFTKITESDQRTVSNGLWTLDISTFEYSPIATYYNEQIRESKWIDNNNIMLIKENSKKPINDKLFKLSF